MLRLTLTAAIIVLSTVASNTHADAMQARRKVEVVLQRGHSRGVQSLAFSADKRFLASAGQDWTVKVWNVATGELIHSFAVDGSWTISVGISPDGMTLAPHLRSG